MVTAIISPLFLWIAKAIILQYASTMEIIFNPIGYLIALFSTFIYNELIIFNCCGLNKNTKKFVNKRILAELKEIHKIEMNPISETDNDSLMTDKN